MDVSRLEDEIAKLGGTLLKFDFSEEGYMFNITPKKKIVRPNCIARLENWNTAGLRVKSIKYSANELTFILIPDTKDEFIDFMCRYIEKYRDCYESEFEAFWCAVTTLEDVIEATSDRELIAKMQQFLKEFVQ